MKKTILILVVVVLVGAIGYFIFTASQAPGQNGGAGAPKIYSEEEKKDILKNLAEQSSTTTIPSVDEQKKILEALANQSQPASSGTTTKASNANASTTGGQGELSDEEKMNILKALAQ